MNQAKIGKFIADMRKLQNLSQRQLADQIGVSDKTVSKWETGIRMPDASILLELCSVLQIDVNELLAGEKFQAEEYSKKTEANIVSLVDELNLASDKHKGRNVGTAVGILFIGLGLLSLLIHSLGISGLLNLLNIPIMLYLLGLIFLTIAISGWFYDFRNAFLFYFHKNRITEKSLEASIEAMKFAGLITLAIGSLVSIIGVINVVVHITITNKLGPALAETLLSAFYTVVLEIIFLVVFFQLKKIRLENPMMDMGR